MKESAIKDKNEKIEFYESLVKEIKFNLSGRKRPLIIEFTGLPKAGKTTVVNSLSMFLRRNGISTIVITERASVCPIKNKHHPDFNIWTGCRTLSNILNYKQANDYSVIIVDRGIYDALIWMALLYKKGKMSKNELEAIENFFLLERWEKSIDLIIYMYTSVEKALEREFKDLLTLKPGSIMNEEFLKEFLTIAHETIDKFSNKYNQIITIDTTQTKTIDGIEKVISEVLDALKKLSDEEIIVFSKELINKRLNFHGFDNNRNKFKVLERLSNKKSIIMRRSDAESNSSVIQAVVISYITYKNQICLFTKHEKFGNKRLHNKKIIWLGGHLQKIDLENLNDCTLQKSITNCLAREIEEEIQISIDVKPKYTGLVYDKTNPKSLQHIGIVFSIDIKDEKVFNSLNGKTFIELSGQGLSLDFVPAKQKYFTENIDSLEPWSANILGKVFNIHIKPTSRQMVLF